MSGRQSLGAILVVGGIVVLWSLQCGVPLPEPGDCGEEEAVSAFERGDVSAEGGGAPAASPDEDASTAIRWRSATIGPAPGERTLLFWSRLAGERASGLPPLAIAVEEYAEEPASIMIYDSGTLLDALAKLEGMGYDADDVRGRVANGAELQPGHFAESVDSAQSAWRLDEEGAFGFGLPGDGALATTDAD